MFDEVLVCLDGSPLAETILPLARAITAPKGGKLTLLRIVRDPAELSAEEDYLRDCARRYGAGLRFIVSTDPASAIGAELERTPRAIAALTTHGRTAWVEGILGSVALQVIRESKQPVILFRPLGEGSKPPEKISTVAVALDATEFSEQIVPYAVRAAQSLSARLLLIQALPVHPPILPGPDQETVVLLESSYLIARLRTLGRPTTSSRMGSSTRRSRGCDLPLFEGYARHTFGDDHPRTQWH